MKYCDTCRATYPTDFSSCPKDQTPLRLTTDLVPGMVIRDKYKIVEKIGAGGMATAYWAKHLLFRPSRRSWRAHGRGWIAPGAMVGSSCR